MTNGADIVSMSFMIVNRDLGQIRGLFRNAFEHLSLGGVLAVGEPVIMVPIRTGRCGRVTNRAA